MYILMYFLVAPNLFLYNILYDLLASEIGTIPAAPYLTFSERWKQLFVSELSNKSSV